MSVVLQPPEKTDEVFYPPPTDKSANGPMSELVFFCPIIVSMVQAIQNVYQDEKDMLQVAAQVKMPRLEPWHTILEKYH